MLVSYDFNELLGRIAAASEESSVPFNRRQLDRLLESQKATYGAAAERFVCPITLQEASEAELCDGHILNQAIPGVSRKTVIQRSVVDSHFGATIEPDLIYFLHARNPSLDNLESLIRRPRDFTVLAPDGEEVRAFPAGREARRRFQGLQFQGPDGPLGPELYLRERKFDETCREAHMRTSTIIPDGAVEGSLLKAAYLACFEMQGYAFVSHPSIAPVRKALCDFFENRAAKEDARSYFGDFAGCARIAASDDRFGDTLEGRMVLIHSSIWGDSEIDFAVSCLFKVGSELILVALPHHNGVGDADRAAHYYSNLREGREFLSFCRLVKHTPEGFQTQCRVALAHVDRTGGE